MTVPRNSGHDDQLERYLGNGAIKYIPTKACKMGIASWQVVDSKTYCWHTVWEDEYGSSGKRDESVGARLVEELQKSLPKRKFLIVIHRAQDGFQPAGVFGMSSGVVLEIPRVVDELNCHLYFTVSRRTPSTPMRR